jgi:septal ring factor EnvC (AmiA/AmiB activator)
MYEFDDDELFEGLTSETDPANEFDVSRVLRTIKKLNYKLEKQKEYKRQLEEKLKAGVADTEAVIASLRDKIQAYMKNEKKAKLSFEDLGSVSVGKAKEDWVFSDDKEQIKALVEQLQENFLKLYVKTSYDLDKVQFKGYLDRLNASEDKTNITNLLAKLPQVELKTLDPSLRITFK